MHTLDMVYVISGKKNMSEGSSTSDVTVFGGEGVKNFVNDL